MAKSSPVTGCCEHNFVKLRFNQDISIIYLISAFKYAKRQKTHLMQELKLFMKLFYNIPNIWVYTCNSPNWKHLRNKVSYHFKLINKYAFIILCLGFAIQNFPLSTFIHVYSICLLWTELQIFCIVIVHRVILYLT